MNFIHLNEIPTDMEKTSKYYNYLLFNAFIYAAFTVWSLDFSLQRHRYAT